MAGWGYLQHLGNHVLQADKVMVDRASQRAEASGAVAGPERMA